MLINKNIQWLLEKDNSPVRYLTLKNLLHRPESDSELQQTLANISGYSVTQGILKLINDFLKDENRAYWKYTGKYWQLIFLGQFHVDSRDQRIIKLANDILNKRKWINKSGGQCLTANILAALMRVGFSDHSLVLEETEALAKRIISDGGIKCSVMDYSLLSRCYMALPKLLLCFAEIPESKRSPGVKNAIKLIVDQLVENEIYIYIPGNRKGWQKVLENQPKKENLPKGQTVKDWTTDQSRKFLEKHGLGNREAKQGWLKFGFPLHYNSDILEAMYALARVNIPLHPNLENSLQIIKDKMTPDGKWILENSLNGKMLVDVEEKGKPSKWLTYFALYVLNHFNSVEIS